LPTERTKATHPSVTLAVLSVSAFAYAVLSAVVIPALPTIQRDLHTTETGVTWLLTSYLLAASVGTSVIGRLGDMYGKERLMVWTLLVLAAGTLLAAVTDSLAVVIVGRTLQGAAGGIFPLAIGIVRDEFPRERVATGIGLLSAMLGVGGGLGIVGSGVIVEHLSWHWLFWIPLVVAVAAALATWRFVPESPIRVSGQVNVVAGLLMAIGISALLLAVSETTVWGWGSVKTIALLLGGFVVCGAWGLVETHAREPLVDMTMMRIRGVWTTNTAAFLLGAGMYSSFIIIPQFAQLPRSTGFGFGASVVVSGLYLLPLSVVMLFMSLLAGRLSLRFGSRLALIAGSIVSCAGFVLIAAAHGRPIDFLVTSGLLGVGIGLAFAALGNLIVSAVPTHQTGIASGMNTVMRTLGGAIGAQLAATFIADHTAHGFPTVTGFVMSFVLAAAVLAVCVLAAAAVPQRGRRAAVQTPVADTGSPAPAMPLRVEASREQV
jgi:EmrB/QacA subfamily drug resistance transporter